MATLDQIFTYFESVLTLWTKHTGRYVSKEVLQERFDICKVCEHFTGKTCKLCGCCTNQRKILFNKLAFPNEECPDGRWFAQKKRGTTRKSSAPFLFT